MKVFNTFIRVSIALVVWLHIASVASAQTSLIVNEFEKLNASNDTQDRFGQNSAIYVDTAIVGAYDVDINGIHSGAAFIYRFDGNTWVEEPILLPSQSSTYAYFGWDVSISDQVAVVSAIGDKEVFVFQFDGTNWNEIAFISLNNSSNDLFGWSVSVDVDRIIVGAPGDNVNGASSGVAYIFEYDGTSWNQQAHLIPSNGSAGEFFGGSVSISGDRALVGAGEQPGMGGGLGTAYIYEYDGTTWNNESILTPSNGNNYDYFGQAVSLQGDVAVIGSMQFDGAGNESGAAYVYRYDGNDWDDETILQASDAVLGQFFGASVCTSDEMIIVGAIGDATSGVQTGAAYVFWYDYTSNTWNEQAKLLPSDAESGDWFGRSVGVHEGTAIVCSWYEDDNGTDAGAGYLYHVGDLDSDGVFDGIDNCIDIFNPNQEDCNANGVGDVCDLLDPATFDCNNNGLVDSCELFAFDIETKILANNGAWGEWYDSFGFSVAVDGDTVVVGAPGEDDNGTDSGSAYIYSFDGTDWVETKITANNGTSYDHFGRSVAVSGDIVVVGAYGDDDNGTDSGSGYIYRFDGSTWNETKLIASDGTAGDNFGFSVAVDGDTVVVGAPGEDDNGTDSGSAYIYSFDGTDWVETKITANNGTSYDHFGRSVAVSGDIVVAGALWDDDNGTDTGSAYIYRFDGTAWIETKLTANDGTSYDYFGVSVAADGDSVVVGAYGDNSRTGSGYIYRFDGSTWNETKLIASDGTAGDYFGASVAVSGDTIVVGAYLESVYGVDSGSAYIYRFDGTAWVETKFYASDLFWDDHFGVSVAADVDKVVVGSHTDFDYGSGSGSAYIYQSSTNDCNLNGIPDDCDIADGTSLDTNYDGIPDECAALNGSRSDFDGNGQVDIDDLLRLIGVFGGVGGVEDLDDDGFVDIDDLLILIGDWGPVE